jgi:hypothetical protein
MKRNSLRVATATFFLLTFTATGWTQTATPLFYIAHSKNANKVYYEARLMETGTLDTIQPIHAYWILWAKDSTGATHEELNEIEKKLAFGFKISDCTPASCAIKLVAFRNRVIEVTLHGKTPRAKMNISGRVTYLKKIFVVSSEGMLIPRVSSVTLYGNDTASGTEIHEVITQR